MPLACENLSDKKTYSINFGCDESNDLKDGVRTVAVVLSLKLVMVKWHTFLV